MVNVLEIENLLDLAEAVIMAATARQESRGAAPGRISQSGMMKTG